MAGKNDYIEEYLDALKKAKSDEEKIIILNKIYDDGFDDGFEDGCNES